MPEFSNILVAPAGFKGVLPSAGVAGAIKEGILAARPDASVTTLPMADGGIGTVDVVAEALGGQMVEVEVAGPLGDTVKAKYTIIEDGQTAVLEMAAAAGWALVLENARDPLRATTRGVGQMIAHAVGKGCKRIIIGLGDSATVDVGVGMASELGVGFLDDRGEAVVPLPKNFSRISRIDMSGLAPELAGIKFTAYADVMNPVIGPAVRVYGPQKGVTGEMMPALEAGVERIVEIMESELGLRLHDEPMTCAAGGLGAGIRAFLNGSLMRGASSIAKLIGLEVSIQNSDLVITGEGRLDRQSFYGKAASEVAALAVNNGKPCWAVIGGVEDADIARRGGIEKIIEISHRQVPSTSEKARSLIIKKVREEFSRV